MYKDPFWQKCRSLFWTPIPPELIEEAEAAHARRVIEIEERRVCVNTHDKDGDCMYCKRRLYMRRFIDDHLLELGL